MAKITINKSKVSNTTWGDVDKTALGKKLSDGYADGNVPKSVINETYAVLKDGAFEDSKTFHQSKGWGPHHQIISGELVVNKGGVTAAAQALAGARSDPNLSSAQLSKAKTHIRRHYRQLKMDIPDSLKESLNVIERGHPLEELVKGSMEYTLNLIKSAFRKQFPSTYDGPYYWITDTFADYVVVESGSDDLLPDEYYQVGYQRDGSRFTFDDKEQWEIIELGYKPQSILVETKVDQRFVESFGDLVLEEALDGGPKRVKAVGITAGVLNGNRRRYPGYVLEAAVKEAQTHLNESLGQGRVQLLGEVEHPSTKGGRPNLFETVFKWDKIDFDGQHSLIEGIVLPTSKGRDIQALLENGVKIPLSQRAYGKSVIIEEDGHKIEEVTELHITGYDATLDPSDPDAGILESLEEIDMELNLDILREKYPDLVRQIETEHDKAKKAELEEALRQKQEEDTKIKKAMAERDKALRAELGLSDTDDLEEAVKARNERLAKLEEQDQIRKVSAYIDEQTKDLKYPAGLLEEMVTAVKDHEPKTVDEAKAAIIAERKIFDAIASKLALAVKGFGGVEVLGPVLEEETGTPEFARVAFELTESVRMAELRVERRDFRKPKTVNEKFTALYLKKFDEQYRQKLVAEAKLFQEAEQASDLNLPYSVSRAVIAEALPRLVASGIFDFGMVDMSPFRLYFEAFSGETGYTGTVTDEEVVTDQDAWVAMDYQRITPGTVVVTSSPAGTTYTEGTDYVIDYANGKIMTLSTGTPIADGATVLVDYTYTAIRKGEMAAIERGKVVLSYVTVDAKADRLADQISREAVVFSRSQIGYDATAKTILSLIKQLSRKIDQGAIYMGLTAALTVASNSGGTWTAASDPVSEFVEKVGVAKIKVANRYYDPTFLLLSLTNSDRIANWDGFTSAGTRPDADLNANGYIGRLKGLPCFESSEMSDSFGLIGNRQLVMHRVYQALQIFGPYPTYDVSNGTSKLLAADQYYIEEFNATESPVEEKGAYVVIA